jgi:CRP/FNR family transcriptional activator FtrB
MPSRLRTGSLRPVVGSVWRDQRRDDKVVVAATAAVGAAALKAKEPMRPSDQQLLEGTPLFRELGERVADRVFRRAVAQTVPKGATVFSQGDVPEFVHMLLSGQVALVAEDAKLGPTIIEFFPAGEVFVAPAAMLELPYLVSARAIEESRILMLPADELRRIISTETAFAAAMARALARHWRLLVKQIKELKLKSASQRLGSYLIAKAPAREGATSFRLAEERKMIAARLGMTPESLSRAFAQLKDAGVSGRGRTIEIADVTRLRDHCCFEDGD